MRFGIGLIDQTPITDGELVFMTVAFLFIVSLVTYLSLKR